MSERLSPAIIKALREYCDDEGIPLVDLAGQIGIQRLPLAAAMAGFGVHAGTIALIKGWLRAQAGG